MTTHHLYIEILPKINSGQVELLDNQRLINQLLGLERRTARSGRDSVDHAPGAHSHDDVINSGVGALIMAGKKRNQHDPRALRFTGEPKVPAHGNIGGSWANRPVLDPEW